MKNFRTLFLVVMAMALLAPAGVWATGITTTMPVTATVTAFATVNATPMNFGSGQAGVSPSGITSTITVNASAGHTYKVSLDAGQHFISAMRDMHDSANDVLSYRLYQDAAMTTEWGDSDAANTYSAGSSVAGTGTGSDQTLTVYGMELSQSNTVPGNYSDTVTVTVIY